FGIHNPAITLLATVLCAQLCSLGSVKKSETGDFSPAYRLRWRGLASVFAAVACVFLALTLASAGWGRHVSTSLSYQVLQAEQSTEPDSWQRRKQYLETAVQLQPRDAELRLELGLIFSERQEVQPALQQFRLARDLCPLLPGPHLELAFYADRM